ncbi:MAG: chitin disaccharide deacetylase [Erysipelotrichaceae bacterium]|nr:chitin disaccharide deacetylase [Erysipelotrichaceae bacterium]MDY5251547.1 chitin disaccharide deacetylase [Erysipelotrichaceae bacterium]
MIKRFIINADDFGISKGAVLGTIETHVNGVVRSTTAMMNMSYVEYALQEAKKYPDLGVGIHLVLTAGKALLPKKTAYLDDEGNFIHKGKYPNGYPEMNEDDLYAEWKAQMVKFIKLAGKKPTHIDSHHHVHTEPQCIKVAKRLAAEYDLPMRMKDENESTNGYEKVKFFSTFYDKNVSIEMIKKLCIENEGTIEIMAHPAYLDSRIYGMSSYNLQRMQELDVLCSDELKTFFAENNIELINYRDIKKVNV